MQKINLNPNLLSELFDLISRLHSEEDLELYDFEITEKSLTCKSYRSLNPDNLDDDLDDFISNWLDGVTFPDLFYNFTWQIDIKNKTLTFNFNHYGESKKNRITYGDKLHII